MTHPAAEHATTADLVGLLKDAWQLIADTADGSRPPAWRDAAYAWNARYATVLGELTAAEPADPGSPAGTPPGRLARVEVKGFRDLGLVRVTETTLAGEPMLHAVREDGVSADFPPSSVHFITWIPDGALTVTEARAALSGPGPRPDFAGFAGRAEDLGDEDDCPDGPF